MSAQEFNDELQRRGLLAERLMDRLRAKVAESNRPLSARAVAAFLVQKQHLTEQQVNEALNALVARGVNVDAAPAAGAAGTPIKSDVVIDESEEGSSIFAPYVQGKSKKPSKKQPSDDPDELTLVDVDDEEFDDVLLTPVDDSPEDELVELIPVTDEQQPTAGRPPKRRDREKIEVVQPVEDLLPMPAAATPPAAPRSSAERPLRLAKDLQVKKKPQKRKSDFDSPLILIGGGVLVLLILCGATVFLLLRNRSGAETLQMAEKAANAGDYGQSIELYEGFLASHKSHPDRSEARVKLAMVRLRRDVEGSNMDLALSTAQKEIADVEQEEKFAATAQQELAALLPRVAQGFANRADAAATLEDANKSIEQANVALELCSNAKYVPDALRNQAQLDEVRTTLARIDRRQQTQKDLQQALVDMAAAVEAGDTNAAYAAHRKLIVARPELATDADLVSMLGKTTAAERAKIRFVAEEKSAETSEPPAPWVATVALAERRAAAAASAAGEAVCVRVEGADYGLDAATGRLLWRRHVGMDKRAALLPLPAYLGGDVLVTDTNSQALVRLNAATGELRWRQAIGEACAAPLVAGEHAYLAAASGRLYVVDLATGARKGFVEFAQPLPVTPAADRQNRRLYVPGERASLYSISLADMSCLGVYHLGHAKGSIRVAPAATQSKLAVMENDGVETCRMRLLSFDQTGAVVGQARERRLTGLAASPPMVAGRRLIVVTDRGQLDVYDVGVGDDENALSLVATREATDSQPLVRYVAAAEGNLWLGDRQLTKHKILPTGNRLPVESLDNDYRGATFDHPLQIVGKTLVHVTRPRGKPGYVAAAIDTDSGRVRWETGLAIPPAGPPLLDPAAQSLTVANANGSVFRLDSAAIRSRVFDQPLTAPPMPPQTRPLAAGVDLGQGRAAYAAPDGDRILLVDTSQASRPVQWASLPGPLACPLTRFGDGLLAPLAMGQVLYLNPADGKEIGTSFQPRLEPGSKIEYTRPGIVEGPERQFVISDGREKIYLVKLAAQSRPQLMAVTEANVGPDPIASPVVIVGDSAIAVTKRARLVRFQLPMLAAASDTQLSAPLVWGPFPVSDGALLATSAGQLVMIKADGSVAWTEPQENGDPVGTPLARGADLLIAYRQGVLERRTAADGRLTGKIDIAQSLDAGPVSFAGRVVLTAHDGTLLVVDQP